MRRSHLACLWVVCAFQLDANLQAATDKRSAATRITTPAQRTGSTPTFRSSDGGATWTGSDRAHRFEARVTSNGAEIVARAVSRAPRSSESASGDSTRTLRLRTKGLAGEASEANEERPCADSPRTLREVNGVIELDHALARERWVLASNRLDQEWTIASRPAGASELAIELDVGGDLSLRIDDGARSATFADARGAPILRYSGLRALDADGRELAARLHSTPRGAVLAVDDRGARYPLTASASVGDAVWSVHSDQNNARLGFSVASAGDVDGDGYGDVITGIHLYSHAENREGGAWVFMGSPSGPSTTPAWLGESDQPFALYGNSVACAGDVNGDGYSDVIVGAYDFDDPDLNEGRAYVYLGSPTGLATEAAWIEENDFAGSYFGWKVASAGDVNGDGYGDVIIGAHKHGSGMLQEDGRAYVYLGSPTGLEADPVWTADGGQTYGFFGYSVAGAGDVNGDGFGDVIVGAFQYDNDQTDEGAAYLYLGSPSGPSPTPAWMVEGDQDASGFGGSVSPAGDVNGDGYADVIIGAVQYDGTQTDEGRAYVYLGSSAGLSASPAWTTSGGQADAGFGNAVNAAGDVNADGYADVVVGARGFDTLVGNEGRAYVYYGSATGLATTASWTLESEQPDSDFGVSVACAGDVDGNGFSDLIVGAFLYDDGQTDEGGAFIYPGASDGLASTSAWTAESNQAESSFGFAVASAGDVNADGFSDVIVGAWLYDNGQVDEGRAYAYYGSASGLSSTPSWIVESNQADAYFGGSVGSAGDVNGDGYGDVVVGAQGYDGAFTDQGRVFVYLGSASGLGVTPAWIASGGQNGENFGYRVDSAGDVNGDGRGDIIVGAYSYDGGQANEGRACVFLGTADGLRPTASWTFESDQANAELGRSVASAGDVNGDGYGDVIIGAPFYDAPEPTEGRAFVFLGSASGLAATPAWTAESDQPFSRFGISVASAGDVNGDGKSDVIVGAHTYDDMEVDEGSAFVYLGSTSGLSTLPVWTVESNQVSAEMAFTVATAGDIDGDGNSDVIVGAHDYTDGFTSVGSAFAYLGSASGLATSQAWMPLNDQGMALFGMDVASAGDVNGDGFGDVIVGAHRYTNGESHEGRVFVFLGNHGAGWTLASQQRQASGARAISLLGRSASRLQFQIELTFDHELESFAWIGGPPAAAHLEWQVAPLGVSFDEVPIQRGAAHPLDGSPIVFRELAEIEVGERTVGIGTAEHVAEGSFHWRARVRTNQQIFPATPWVSLAGNNVTEAKLSLPDLHTGTRESR